MPLHMLLKNHPNIALRLVQPHGSIPRIVNAVGPALATLAQEAIQEAFDSHRTLGLLPQYRGNGLYLEIINTMREYAAYQYPHAQHFVEFMPVDEGHNDMARYFEAAGFKKWGAPEAMEWSDVPWQEYVCNIREPLRYHPAPIVDNPAP